ncbi:membrane integrity-associated transporter subunit PqiC [Citreicella sp. C3M06]|uniref:ABC-type transport auxiliary lipoprotein family protein n=1 Tax=Citreicella sp. C3M06 TaxID=2841564 RepID=UPI001C092D31|nr:ABC-type transport auxiliary lipoprotein family protein [Citreicella sp. C3M06]MBU2959390.1 membrane integrity-associated transporter subunit PqiC [Citreicella sp. C3M06]
MRIRSAMRRAVLTLGLATLAGCSALSSIDSASKPLNTYELSPLPAVSGTVRRGRASIEVAMPTTTGALSSDRIVIKPTPREIQTLPDARWVDDAAAHVQLLLVRSLANSGRFSLVTSAGVGPTPDYVLMSDLQAFQAEVSGDEVKVVIQSTLTLLRDSDGAILASRSFSSAVPVADTSAARIVEAFDMAMTAQLTEMVDWLASTRGL